MKFWQHVVISGLLMLMAYASAARPSLEKPYLKAPVLLDGRPAQEIWIFPRERQEDFSVEAGPLLELLKTELKDDLYLRLKSLERPQGVLTLRDLEDVGFSAQFDAATLELRLALPPRYRKPRDLNLNFVEFGNQKFLRPNQHSGYLNLRSQQSWQYGSEGDQRLPLTGNVELVENIRGFVFETSVDFQEGDEHQWQRQDTRLRYDDEERMIRYTLGDLTYRSAGFQLSPSLAGLAATREFSIQPYRTLKPLSDTEVVIRRTSLVEIYVNGLLFSQLRLAPGVFNIRDFPLATGQSSIRIKVKDDLGQEETYDFSLLYENSLLAQGEDEFSYAVGFPWTSSEGDRAYDGDGAMVSFFHRRGVTNQLTLGLNFQSYSSQTLLGLEMSGVSRWGYLSAQVAQGSTSAAEAGNAEKMTYRTLEKIDGNQMPVILTIEAENRDKDFRPVDVQGYQDPGMLYLRRYDAQLNYRINSSWLLGLGAGVLEYAAQEDQRVYRSNLMIPLTGQMRIEFAYNRMTSASEEDRYLLSFYWNERQGYYSASSYYDSLGNTGNVAVNRHNRYQYDDYRWSASVQKSDSVQLRSLSGEYLTQPMSIRLDHLNTEQAGESSNTTSLGLNTGFAWVGGHGAFTQPVTDSFVLIRSDSLPQGQSMMVNPRGVKGQAQLGPRNNVVLRDQSSYYRNTVNVDSTSLPMGYLLDREFYGTQNTYRSGILLDLKIRKLVMVRGQMLDSSGRPVVYAAGDVFNQQGQLIDNTFFTNKDGRFMIEGLEPGTYKVITDRGDVGVFTFSVPKEAEKILNLGPIKPAGPRGGTL